jgi:hypothetical protein
VNAHRKSLVRAIFIYSSLEVIPAKMSNQWDISN